MKKLISIIRQAAELNAKLTGIPVQKSYSDQLAELGKGRFQLVVMGEVKKGKSSFINAMLGIKDLLPVLSDVATSTIYKVQYGPSITYRVHFARQTGMSPLTVSSEEVAEFGTEDGNPGNVKEVEYIEVSCPSPLLESGVVIVDTPGLGGLFKAHKKVTWQYVPQSDAVFFVTDSVESPIGRLELEYVDAVRAITNNFYFVQTKSCSVDAESCTARSTNNLSILSSHLGVEPASIRYFTVDSELRFDAEDAEDLEISGYPRLMSYITEELQAKQKRAVAERVLCFARPVLQNLVDEIGTRQRTLAADSQGKLAEIKAEWDKNKAELDAWESTGRVKLVEDFKLGMLGISRQAEMECGACVPGGDMHLGFQGRIDRAGTIQELKGVLEGLNNDVPCTLSDYGAKVICLARGGVQGLLGRLSLSAYASTLPAADVRFDSGNMHLAQVAEEIKNRETSMLENAQTVWQGCRMGGFVGGVIGGILGSIIPGVGNACGAALGATIGGAWGGHQASVDRGAKDLEMSKKQGKAALSQSFASFHGRLLDSLRKIFMEIDIRMNSAISNYAAVYRKKLTDQQVALQTRQKLSNDEISKKRAAINALDAEVKKILGALQPYSTAGKGL